MLVHLYSSDPLSFSEDRHEKGHHHCFGCRGAALHTSHWNGKRTDQLALTLRIRARRARSAGLVTTARTSRAALAHGEVVLWLNESTQPARIWL